MQEEGGGDINASNWTAFLAPAGTPQPILDKLNAEVVKILNMPDVKERFAAGGVLTIPSSAAELVARVKREAAVYRDHHREGQRPRRLTFPLRRRKGSRPVRGMVLCDVQANPDCQSRRDRLPHHQDRPPDGDRHGRGLFRSRP